jgi:hypothetical protein
MFSLQLKVLKKFVGECKFLSRGGRADQYRGIEETTKLRKKKLLPSRSAKIQSVAARYRAAAVGRSVDLGSADCNSVTVSRYKNF